MVARVGGAPEGHRLIRVVIPDSHGHNIDPAARDAFLGDLKFLDPNEIVGLGDHSDCEGWASVHKPMSVEDLDYSYSDDIASSASFWDAVQKAAPKATYHILEGNHEQHIERWIVNLVRHRRDATSVLRDLAPHAQLRFKERGFKFYRYHQCYMGLTVPNTIKLGKCYFTHGAKTCKHSAAAMLSDFGAPVVFGHIHRSQGYISRTVGADVIGAWCPGTLAKLQPTYLHNQVSSWSHGYGLQFVSKSGTFQHINVAIVRGKSLLGPLLEHLR